MEDWLQKIDLRDYRYALISFPEDRGVRTNNGRPGAADGPAAIRKALSSHVDFKKIQLVDLGDAPSTDSLLERQKWLGSAVQSCFEANVFPIVLGGGHETAYGHYLGYTPSPRPSTSSGLPSPARGERDQGGLRVLNIDAHYDCRPLVDGEGHSGSPFRQMIEAGLPGESLTAFGIQRSCNSGPNVEFAIEKKVRTFFLEEIRREGIESSLEKVLEKSRGLLYVTIDLDGLAPFEFPATSAAVKMKEGFSVKEMEEMIRLLARHPALTSLDFCEYSPPFDSDGACAKMASKFLEQFLVQRHSRR
ncbi:MAG: formimidoylglutamase [Deltaproteobacteria bacterium]|nr:formimidoylglutamase [Deltaproteobacteria bacterium]